MPSAAQRISLTTLCRYLLRALAEGGRSDVIFDMTNQSDKPGYGSIDNFSQTGIFSRQPMVFR